MNEPIQKHETLSSQKFWFLSLSVVIFLFLLHPFLDYETQFVYITVTVYAVVPAAMVAGAIILYVKHVPTKQENFKFAFLMLVIALTSYFWAEQIWNMYDHVLDGDPFPSYADFFYIGFYPFFFIFITRYLKFIKQKIDIKVIAFAVGISISFLTPTFLAAYDWNAEEESFPKFVALIYPTLDPIILTPTIIGLLYGFKNRKNMFLAKMLIGFLFIFVADTWFLYVEISESYYDGHPVDIFWLLGYVTFTFAIFHQIKQERTERLFGVKNSTSQSISTETITKFVVPLTLITIVTVVVMSLVYVDFYAEKQETPPDILRSFSTYGILVILGVFSIIIMVINQNLSKIVKMRTKELEEKQQGLEKLVEEKTKELIKNERLSAIGEFSSRIAHDLRNPLASIKGAAELIRIKSKHPDDLTLPYFSVIDEGINRMKHMVDDVLDYVRVTPLKISNQQISELIQSTLDRVKIPAGVKIDVPKKDIEIQCDPDKIEIVFINLLVNSIQAVGKSGEIKIKTHDYDDFITIEFEDSGEGIKEENIEKIFQPLFTTKQEGTGLGLSSCKNIIEQHGGTITIKNNPTRFSVNLPKTLKIKTE